MVKKLISYDDAVVAGSRLPVTVRAEVRALNVVDVRSYGAAVNGTTNDTTAVQNAANAAAGKTLYFPAGTTRVTSINLPSGVRVIGEGPTSIIKQLTLPVGNPSPVFDALSNTHISHIKIDGNRVANIPDSWSDSYCDAGKGYKNSPAGGRGRGFRCGIRGESITGLTVANVELTEIAGAALATNMSSDITMQACYVHDTDFEAATIYGDGFPVSTYSGANVRILNNTITNLEAPAAAGGTQPDAIVMSRIVGGLVSGNTMNGVDRCFIKMESNQNIIISHNTISVGRVNYPAIQISPYTNRPDIPTKNIRVTSNSIAGPGFQAGVQINSWNTGANVTSDIEVDNNTFVSNLVFGVLMDGNTGLTNINVHNNFINGTSSHCIYVNGGGTGLSLWTNKNDGVAMADLLIPGAFTSSIQGRN